MTTRPYVYVWSYQVRPERVAEFERTYGPEGEWVALFRRAAGYCSTRLLADCDRPGWYMTVDTWDSVEAFEKFRRTRSADFETLDRQCEQLSLTETLVGRFQHAGSPGTVEASGG